MSHSDNFETLKVPQLRDYLMLRGVPCSDASKSQLVELAKFANKLGLKASATAEQTTKAISDER